MSSGTQWFGLGLPAHASIDPLAQQVRMSHVARALMDHSDQHLTRVGHMACGVDFATRFVAEAPILDPAHRHEKGQLTARATGWHGTGRAVL